MVIDKVALTLAVIGALNWGSIGLFGFDLVAFLCGGQMGTVSRVIYTLVGLAGVWCITMLFRETEPIEATRTPNTHKKKKRAASPLFLYLFLRSRRRIVSSSGVT